MNVIVNLIESNIEIISSENAENSPSAIIIA
jgi:hypothetical protein